MAHIPHALSLPEVAFPVAQYLELDDLAACSLVYKSFYASFAPYLWANVQLEVPSASEENSTPPRFTSKIDLSQYTRPSSPKNSTMDTLAIPIRRLYFHYAARCTNLHSILISAHSCAIQYEEAYWNTCEALVRQNSNCLRSLTLLDWRLRISNPLYPFWNLLHTCAQHANLSKLRTRYGKFHAQELEAFWTICRQLEILELTDMDIQTDIPTTHGAIPAIDGVLSSPSTKPVTPTAVRFPKLLGLTLDGIKLRPEHQMEQFILQSPMLHTLVLRLKAYKFSLDHFCDCFAAQT
ncbi:hypothetical protein BGX31_001799, partial [Mortierella sp. GBA43]